MAPLRIVMEKVPHGATSSGDAFRMSCTAAQGAVLSREKSRPLKGGKRKRGVR